MRRLVIAIGALCLFGILLLADAQAERSVWSGVYSEDQAKRGQTLFEQKCASCHGTSLQGMEQAAPLTGVSFATNWNGRTLGELFETMRLSMPADDPGTLTPQQNADLLAYMLSVGKFPAGTTALPGDRQALDQILFVATKR